LFYCTCGTENIRKVKSEIEVSKGVRIILSVELLLIYFNSSSHLHLAGIGSSFRLARVGIRPS
jgi:hypothetical protein